MSLREEPNPILAERVATDHLPLTRPKILLVDDDKDDSAAVAHGQLRCRQGYTAPLMVQESRMLQVCIFETIERNLATVNFSAVLPDIMIIADEVDAQLKQSIDSFLTMERRGAALASSA